MSSDNFRPAEEKISLRCDNDIRPTEESDLISQDEAGSLISGQSVEEAVSLHSGSQHVLVVPNKVKKSTSAPASSARPQHQLTLVIWFSLFGLGTYILGDQLGGRDGALLQVSFLIVLIGFTSFVWQRKRVRKLTPWAYKPWGHKHIFFAGPASVAVVVFLWLVLKQFPESMIPLSPPIEGSLGKVGDWIQMLALILALYINCVGEQKS
ncbi:MAG: hypothetical protein K2Z81_00525 [Cyanobacteria bacterium]|nr:hypothetical protein [Cyanobacteriota bacterium]